MWVAPFGNLRVDGYLLLTAAYRSLSRPSSAPDAKAFPLRSFQLDLLVANSACCAPAASLKASGESLLRSVAPRFRLKSEDFRRDEDGGRSLQRVFTEIAILMNYAGFTKKFFEIVIVTLHPFGCCSTIKTYASRHFWRLPLCCLTSLSSHCSVFKVQYFQPLLKPDLKIQIPLGFEIQQQNAVFCLVGLSGLEPPTLRLSVVRSSQLSYRPVWWR